MTITRDNLVRMFPHARKDWIDAFENLSNPLVAHYDMSRLDWCHFCGQIEAETNGLQLNPMRENMNYTSASRILKIFSYRLGLFIRKDGTLNGRSFRSKYTLAQYLVRKPKHLADVTYGGREGTPWLEGSKYLGRGPFQTTHRNNYRAAATEIARQPSADDVPDLVSEPEVLAHNAEMGVRAAFAEFKLKKLSPWARKDDVWSVSKILNTGSRKSRVQPHGLRRRRRGTARAKAIWTSGSWEQPTETALPKTTTPDLILDVGDRGDDVLALQKALQQKGYFSGDLDGIYGQLTRRAVVAFQDEHGLPVTGSVNWDEQSTFRDVLNATDKIDLGKREQISEKDLRKSGSRTIKNFDFFGRLSKMWTAIIGALGLDKLFEFGAFETVVSQGEKVKSLGDRAGQLIGYDIPWMWVLIVSGLVLGLWAWRKVNQGIAARVQDSREGKNLGRV